MRNLKKFLALVLAMMMAFSLMLTANAAVTSNVSYPDNGSADAAFEEAITVLSGMGVFSGDNGEFYPTRNVTRAEAAALVYRLATGDVNDTQADLYAKYGNFSDVTPDKWYAGYVGYCANAGYIKGRPGNVFDPTGSVTGYEILAMILRVVGYDKNGEFTGADWQVNVSALSQSLGVVANVNSTQYGGTLYLPAQRQVVADLLFQTDAYIPTVNYTTAFGYQPFGTTGGVVGSVKNQTLGEKIFGLTCNTGVIVGNEVTGEAKGITKVGFSLQSSVDGTVYTIDDTMAIRHKLIDTDFDGAAEEDYFGSAYVYASDTTTSIAGGANGGTTKRESNPLNVTLAFKWDSNLETFNHAMKIWYDNRSSQYELCGSSQNIAEQYRFPTNLNTYAMFDQVTNVAVISLGEDNKADEASLASGKALLGEATNSTTDYVLNNWTAPGFGVRRSAFYSMDGTTLTPAMNAAYFNYSFGPITHLNYGNNVTDAQSAISPVEKNNGDTDIGDEEYGLYLLISNSADKTLDVVIPLQMTFSKIGQANNTTAPKSVGVINGNISPVTTGSSANKYFDTWDTVESANHTEYANIAQANLVNSPNIALNTKVAAIQVTGTAGPNADGRVGATVADHDYGFAKDYNVDATADDDSNYYYQLTENTLKETYKVLMINPLNQDLTVQTSSGTKVLHQSVFAEAVDATFTTNMEGVAVKNDKSYTKQLEEGRDYTFTMDRAGNYIYWTTPSDTAKFVYGTYIDWETVTASSSFVYPLVYVSQNGEAKQKANITKAPVWNASSAPSAWSQQPMGNDAYNLIELNKRDNNAVNSSGYMKGYYIGYALTDSGELKRVTDSNSQDTGFIQATDGNWGAATYSSGTKNGVLVDKNAVELGAVQIVGGGAGEVDLFLTERTQFYVVNGAGTDNQTVTPYKGISELKGTYESVVINVSDTDSPLLTASKYLAAASATDDDTDGKAAPYDMVYYSLDRTDYAQSYMGSAKEVLTVFLPEEALERTASVSKTLHFVGDNTLTNISVIRGDQITQFTMYDEEGNQGSYWVEGYVYDGTSAAWVIDQLGDNVFYNLVETGNATVDGQPIYTVRPLTATNAKRVIGKYLDDTTTAWTINASGVSVFSATSVGYKVASTGDEAEYAATTTNSQVAYIDDTVSSTSQLYNVAKAVIRNLNQGTYPGIVDNNLGTLNDAGSLTDNTGVPVSCVISGLTVDVVFVNAPIPSGETY